MKNVGFADYKEGVVGNKIDVSVNNISPAESGVAGGIEVTISGKGFPISYKNCANV